jgi:biotin operon repressor
MTATRAQLLMTMNKHGHIGGARGASAKALAALLGCPERHVRKLVTELRDEGVALCGTPRGGYFIAATAEELDQTCAFLRGRALHSLQLESRLRKLPLAELLGQLTLPT